MHKDLSIFNKLVDELLKEEISEPVVEPINPNTLKKELDLALTDEPAIDSEFESSLRDIVLSTPRTATRMFFNQLYGGRNSKAVLGDLLAVMLNTSMYTYKVAGPQVGIEKEIISKVCAMVGYDDANSDGTIATGGSLSNMMAMIMARDAFTPEVGNKGVQGTYTMYTSRESHYSIVKNASFIGVGRNQVRYIDTDDFGRLDVNDLDKKIQLDIEAGNSPFFVNATAGTTVLGAFDPVNAMADVCEKYKVWLHIDGAYCGAVLFSEKYKHLLNGSDRADSFSFNAHKMLGTPLTCSLIVTKDKQQLNESFSADADYLYQTDADDFNLGKTSVQCGRRNDALKLWTLWKSVGTKGLEEIVDYQFELADVARAYITDNSDYSLYSFDDSISICFNYKDIPANTLCTLLYENAEIMVGFGVFEEDQFVRLVTINSSISKEDILNFFKKLEEFAESQVLV